MLWVEVDVLERELAGIFASLSSLSKWSELGCHVTLVRARGRNEGVWSVTVACGRPSEEHVPDSCRF